MGVICARIVVFRNLISIILSFSHHAMQLATAILAADLPPTAFTDAAHEVGALELRKNWGSHIDASHSRQPLVKGERLVRHEVNAVMVTVACLNSNFSKSHVSSTDDCLVLPPHQLCSTPFIVGSSSQANCLLRNSAMDDSIGGS